MPGRLLSWEGCHNVRDLGGLPTTEGGRIRPGALVRADDLGRLTAVGVAALRAYGISRILDLRGSAEVTRAPNPFAGDPVHRHTPFIDEIADRLRDRAAEATVAATYLGSVVRNAGNIAAVVSAIAEAPAGGVLVHCVAGKDRTGMIVALVLRLADVPVDEIAADYALTAACLRERFEAELAGVTDPAARAKLVSLRCCRPENILGALARVEQRHGDVASYLLQHGVSPEQLAALRERLSAR